MTHLASAQPDGARRFPAPALALDFGGTSMRAALVLPDGSLHGRRRADTPRSDAAAFAEACRELLSRTLDGAAESPVALAISAPGPLDPRAGVLVDPPNLPQGLWNYPIAETLGAAVSLPAHLERDTLVAALGEGAFGAARGVADYVYLTVSTGLGGAVVSDGRLLRGADGAAGELGHLLIDIDGPACGCGARGHLEAYASG
ncbi:MAG TPA: ROK family protein, partial [Candidatus Limnocylindria bacterium]|nr:ROK family protein [Candidatus Limnocylindria bacterium]